MVQSEAAARELSVVRAGPRARGKGQGRERGGGGRGRESENSASFASLAGDEERARPRPVAAIDTRAPRGNKKSFRKRGIDRGRSL